MALHLSGLKILLFSPFWHVYCFVKHGKPVLAACATWSHQNRYR
ncbi:hypothetical protein SMA01_4506 [Salmonella enterica subsp. enterica serovar Manhattan str. 111113]|nr:hypothetical protein SMA01_4506 [Salmonella enterica subsp. enterica serovar Manhattan str. 111113]